MVKSIAVPVTRKRTTAAKPRPAGRPTPPADGQVGGTAGPPRRAAPPLVPAAGHRYGIGERLQMVGGGRSWSRAEGVCEVTALMPHERGPLMYRVRSELESFERVVAEEDLTRIGE